MNTAKPVMCINYISNSPVFVLDKPSNPEGNLGDLHVPSFNICGCAFWNTHLMATINHKSRTESKTKLRTGLCMWVTWTQENVSMGDSLYLSYQLWQEWTFFLLWLENKNVEFWRNQALEYNRFKKTCCRPDAINIKPTNMVAYTETRF